MEEDLSLKKAILVSGGAVRIPNGYRVPTRISRSTAGPGAGSGSVVFSFGGSRVKKTITREESEFELSSDGTSILRNGEPFLNGVSIVPVAYHCPEQAFFNLDQRCMFKCVYCASPLLDRNATKGLDGHKMVSMIRECREPIYAIALTSGVYGSVDDTVKRMAECISILRKEFPELPIGVEPYVSKNEHIDMLREAGATEIKINCEAATKELFSKACPDLDYDNIFDMLAYAVKLFGKGSVASNLIIGLGETDKELDILMERLCSMGVAPGLRGLRIGDSVKDNVAKVLGITDTPSPERLVRMAKSQKQIMEKYGLRSDSFSTMCFRCTCCDVTPFVDL